jgi:hypothetical protein
MKTFKNTVAFPALLPQKNWMFRGPGGERNATMTTVAKPSLSVMTGELRDANGWEEMSDADTKRLTKLEGTPFVVKTKDEAC